MKGRWLDVYVAGGMNGGLVVFEVKEEDMCTDGVVGGVGFVALGDGSVRECRGERISRVCSLSSY